VHFTHCAALWVFESPFPHYSHVEAEVVQVWQVEEVNAPIRADPALQKASSVELGSGEKMPVLRGNVVLDCNSTAPFSLKESR